MKVHLHKHPKVHRSQNLKRETKAKTKYKFIEDFRNKEAGKEIWLLACGPSLDDFSDNFFDDKTTMAIKWTFVAFPKCTYNLASWSNRYLMESIKKNYDHHDNFIINVRGHQLVPGWTEPIYMRVRGGRGKDIHDKSYYIETRDHILAGEPFLYGNTNTCGHWAIQAAVILGAKKITLVGFDHHSAKYFRHAVKRGMGKAYEEHNKHFGIPQEGILQPLSAQQGINPSCLDLRKGTQWLVEIFGQSGIEIRRYFYKTGYEEKLPWNTT